MNATAQQETLTTRPPDENRLPQALINRARRLAGYGDIEGAKRLFAKLQEVVGHDEATSLAMEHRFHVPAAALPPDPRTFNTFQHTRCRLGFCR